MGHSGIGLTLTLSVQRSYWKVLSTVVMLKDHSREYMCRMNS